MKDERKKIRLEKLKKNSIIIFFFFLVVSASTYAELWGMRGNEYYPLYNDSWINVTSNNYSFINGGRICTDNNALCLSSCGDVNYNGPWTNDSDSINPKSGYPLRVDFNNNLVLDGSNEPSVSILDSADAWLMLETDHAFTGEGVVKGRTNLRIWAYDFFGNNKLIFDVGTAGNTVGYATTSMWNLLTSLNVSNSINATKICITNDGCVSSWNDVNDSTYDYNMSDDLGNHNATQNLNMNDYNINNFSNMSGDTFSVTRELSGAVYFRLYPPSGTSAVISSSGLLSFDFNNSGTMEQALGFSDGQMQTQNDIKITNIVAEDSSIWFSNTNAASWFQHDSGINRFVHGYDNTTGVYRFGSGFIWTISNGVHSLTSTNEIMNMSVVNGVVHNTIVHFLKDVIFKGDVDVEGNFTGNQIYAEAWYHNHTATEMTFADGVNYSLYFNNYTLNGFEQEGIYNLSTQVAGLYSVNYIASGDGQNNHDYYTSVFVEEDNRINCDSHKKMTAGGDIVTMSGTCFIRLEVDDSVSLRVMDEGGTGTGNYYSSNLNLVRIGD